MVSVGLDLSPAASYALAACPMAIKPAAMPAG